MPFYFIGSTGRTATTYIAAYLNRLSGVTACHEGYPGGEHDTPLLPLINLENAQVFRRPDQGLAIVEKKRNTETLREATTSAHAGTLIDVAYYNAALAGPLLTTHLSSKGVGIIRDCESFVRSCTTLTGEDDLPVGWPDPAKPLSKREAFIQMGRIKPDKKSADGKKWNSWSAIQRNIWLWRETNLLLLRAAELFPSRFAILNFQDFKDDATAFLTRICNHFDLEADPADLSKPIDEDKVNKKSFGYQVGPLSDWTTEERALLEAAEQQIWSRCS